MCYLCPHNLLGSMTRRVLLFLLTIVGFAQGARSQQPPQTQLYVFDMRITDTLINLTQPRYLSAFNANGYNNQPTWIDRNRLYASVQTSGQAQPDVYLFDLAAGTRQRLTATESGEYSPKPLRDGEGFSAVRQEFGSRDTVIRLWQFPNDLGDGGRPVFPSMNGTGYYEWLNDNQLALFVVGNPNQLVLRSIDSEQPRTLASDIGRSFHRRRNGNLVYVDKSTNPWRLTEKSLYRLEDAPRPIVTMPSDTEDFIILSDGTFLTGSGSRLYRYDPLRGGDDWRLVVDLSQYGFNDITRLAQNGRGQLALVAE